MKYDIYKIMTISIIVIMSIVAYGTYRCNSPEFHDPLTNSVAGPPFDRYLDGWGITHFIFYGLLAYMFPKRIILIFLLGVAWEIIEVIFKDHPFYLSECKYEITTSHGGWWYGRWEDIVMNSLGILVGYTAAGWRGL
jgi:hypothetical protein